MFNEDLFKDVIGYDEEKESLKRVIDMLNNPDKYKELGCDMLHNLTYKYSSGSKGFEFIVDDSGKVSKIKWHNYNYNDK